VIDYERPRQFQQACGCVVLWDDGHWWATSCSAHAEPSAARAPRPVEARRPPDRCEERPVAEARRPPPVVVEDLPLPGFASDGALGMS
jgi:hypothetical protein